MLSAADMAMMRNAVGSLRTTPCQILRYTGTWAVISANGLTCQVSADKEQRAIPGTEGTQQQRRWIIRLPVGQDVQRGDRILALGFAYSVNELGSPPTIELATIVYAYALWTVDAGGNPTGPPLYLSFNAVVTTKAAGVVKLSNVPAMIGEPDARALDNYGGIVKHVVQLAPQSDVNNVRPGDQLYIQSWGANAVDSTKPYYVIQENSDGPLGMEFHRLVISDKQQR